MSSRQLRKLQKQKELEKEQDPAGDSLQEHEDEDDYEPEVAKPRVSLFAALEGGEDENEDGDDDPDEDEVPGQTADRDAQQDVNEAPEPSTSSKSKKKSKKKKKKKAVAALPAASDANKPDENLDADDSEDEIDKAMKELNIKTRNDAGSGEGSGRSTDAHGGGLFKINPYHLRAVNEMKNLFGRDIMESASAEEEQENNRRRRQRLPQQVDLETYLREPPGAKKLPEVSLRRNVFVQGREHWPAQSAGGLKMEEIRKAPDGSWTEYAYLHDTNYDDIQSIFFSCVQIGDPMRMVHLLKQFPYHVSTLLQVSSVAKQDQNMALASELCERALFTFGRVTTTSFRQNIEQGRARLDFRRPENRQLWLAGYHYLKSLVRKGTYRTALEWSKLLYTLDPADPYAMRHFIHFLAIRAYNAQWLIDVMDQIEKDTDNRDTIYLRQTLVLAKLQLKDEDGARESLIAGMQRVPWLYCALFQELGLDAPPSIWGVNTETDTRSFWVKLYIYQTKDLWNNPQATTLLQAVAKSLDRVDVASLPSDDPPIDLGPTRLAYLEGQTSLMGLVPRGLLERQPNYEFDPLPPAEDENIFTTEGSRMPWRDSRATSLQTAQAQLQMLMNENARIAAARGPRGPLRDPEDDLFEDDDADELEARRLDDEELQRDLEEHARRNDRPGMLAALMDVLGLRRYEAPDDGDDDSTAEGGREQVREREPAEEEENEEDEGPPGAWPGM